jgi:hypothetical protein
MFPKNWTDHEKAYNEFMWIMGHRSDRGPSWVTSGTGGGRVSRQ